MLALPQITLAPIFSADLALQLRSTDEWLVVATVLLAETCKCAEMQGYPRVVVKTSTDYDVVGLGETEGNLLVTFAEKSRRGILCAVGDVLVAYVAFN